MKVLYSIMPDGPGRVCLLLLGWVISTVMLFGQTDTSIAVTVQPRVQLTGTVTATTEGGTRVFTLTDFEGGVHILDPETIEYFTSFDRGGNRLLYRSISETGAGAGAEFMLFEYRGGYDIYQSDSGTTWLYRREDSSFVRVPTERQLRRQLIDSLLPRTPVLSSGRMYRGGTKRIKTAIAYMDSPFRKYPSEYFTLRIAGSQFREAYRFRTAARSWPGNINDILPTLEFTNLRLGVELSMIDGFNDRGNLAVRVALGGSMIRGNAFLREESLTYVVSRNASLAHGDVGLRWYVGRYRLFPYLGIGGRVDVPLRDKFLAAKITRRESEATLLTVTHSLLRTGVSPRCSAGLEVPLTARRYVDFGLSAYYIQNAVGTGRLEYQVSVAVNFNA